MKTIFDCRHKSASAGKISLTKLLITFSFTLHNNYWLIVCHHRRSNELTRVTSSGRPQQPSLSENMQNVWPIDLALESLAEMLEKQFDVQTFFFSCI